MKRHVQGCRPGFMCSCERSRLRSALAFYANAQEHKHDDRGELALATLKDTSHDPDHYELVADLWRTP